MASGRFIPERAFIEEDALTSKEDRKLDKAMAKRPIDGVRVIEKDPQIA